MYLKPQYVKSFFLTSWEPKNQKLRQGLGPPGPIFVASRVNRIIAHFITYGCRFLKITSQICPQFCPPLPPPTPGLFLKHDGLYTQAM